MWNVIMYRILTGWRQNVDKWVWILALLPKNLMMSSTLFLAGWGLGKNSPLSWKTDLCLSDDLQPLYTWRVTTDQWPQWPARLSGPRSRYEEPTADEGFSEIVRLDCRPTFSDPERERLYRLYLLEKWAATGSTCSRSEPLPTLPAREVSRCRLYLLEKWAALRAREVSC